MTIAQELKQAVAKLPLEERQELLEALERSIADEIDQTVADDIRAAERQLAEAPFTAEQMRELNARVAAAERGEAGYVPWEQVWEEILTSFRHRAG